MSKEVRLRDAERILFNNGFVLDRIKGGHHYYTRGSSHVMLNLKPNRMVWQRIVKENNLS